MAKEMVRYDKLLKVKIERLQKEVKELRAENEGLQSRTEAAEMSDNKRMQEALASEAALWVERFRTFERISILEGELTLKTNMEV